MLYCRHEDTITDLKQFIATVVRTTVKEELVEIEHRLGRLEEKIDQKGDEILNAIAATMQNHIEYADDRLDNHEKRIVRLEHKAA